MNSISVTGKDWILKKFDQSKIVYLKENYSIDEITAKLLVIRNIKLEDIKKLFKPFHQKLLTKSRCFVRYA